MKNKLYRQTGYGTHALLAGFVIAAVLGAGWFVWQQRATTRASQTPTSRPDNTSAVADRQTYTSKLGITLELPNQAQVANGRPCSQVSYRYDSNGRKQTAPASYTATAGVVPLMVVEQATQLYVVPQYTYQPGSPVPAAGSAPAYTSCAKVATNISVLAQALQNKVGGYTIEALGMQVSPATSENAVKVWLQQQSSAVITNVTLASADKYGGQSVTWTCTKQDKCYSAGHKTVIRYYPKLQRLLVINLGQGAFFQAPDGHGYYSEAIADSARLQ